MASNSTNSQEPQNNKSLALSDHGIITRLTLCHNMGLSIQGIKAQVLEMESKKYSLDQIRDYIDNIAKEAYAQIQKAKKQQEKNRGKPQQKGPQSSSSSSETNPIQDPNLQTGDRNTTGEEKRLAPYFRMIPPVQTYELLEMHLFILHQLFNAGRDYEFVKDHPFSMNNVNVWKFVDSAADAYTLNLSQNDMLRQKRLEFYKKQTSIEGISLTDIKDDDWLNSLEDQNLASEYRDTRINVKQAINEHLFFLDRHRFIAINTPSEANSENLIKDKDGNPKQAISKDVDSIRIEKKGFIFLQMYQHVLDQRDQRGCMGYLLNLALDKNATW